MAKRQVKKQDNEPKTTNKGLFDHLRQITETKDPKYFESLNDTEKKTFSTYMINRFLSMEMDYCPVIAELDPLTVGNQLSPNLVYKLYCDVFPQQKVYLKYVKGVNEDKYNKDLVTLLANHFMISKKESIDYLQIYMMSEDKIEKLKQLISLYGYTEKEIKKLMTS